ncbi:PorV/PorQ family protein [Bacteroidia bacterium]|nr:PorV/PorQ family protein [Bacteroidia bacterium]
MRITNLIFLLIFGAIAQAQILPNFGGQRAGLSALSFLKNDMNPASFAMASASVANDANLYSSESNPAALALVDHSGLALSNLAIGAGVHQSFAGGTIKLKSGVLGVNVNSLNSGSMEVRTEFEPNGTGQQFYANNTALGLNYAQKLSSRFSIGVGLKYVYEGISTYRNSTLTGDIGFLYTTDFKDLTFAVVVKNFGGNSQMKGSDLESDFNRTEVSLEKYTTPAIFKMGFSFVPYEDDSKKLLVAAELNHPSDNAENIRLGGELALRDLLFLRLGYKLSVKGQNYPTAGIGVKTRIGNHPLYIDYGVNPTNRMGVLHIFGLHVPFNNDKR